MMANQIWRKTHGASAGGRVVPQGPWKKKAMPSKSLSSRSCLHVEFCYWNPPCCNLRSKHGSRIDNTAGANHQAKVTFFQLFLGSIQHLLIQILTKPDDMRPQ